MKILFVAAHFDPGPGGADISARNLLLGLRRRGFRIKVVTDERSRSTVTPEWRQGMEFAFSTDAELRGTLDAVVGTFRPDVLFTQSRWVEAAARYSNEVGLRSVLFIHAIDRPPRWDLSRSSACSPTLLVTNSPATTQYARDVWGRECVELNPAVTREECVTGELPNASPYVTMINPVREKGGELFRDIARIMPHTRFRAVRGWKGLSKGSRDSVPMGDNVLVDGPFQDIRDVYASTRLLLVPSLCEEAFGRVAVEAMMNGIPVLAAQRGALPWVVQDGGSTLATRDRDEWAREIRSYGDMEKYRRVSDRARERARFFDADAQIDSFAGRLRALGVRG